MKLVFSGLESSLKLKQGRAVVLEVENAKLFCRICQSLVSGEGRQAVEPYTLWSDEGKEIGPKGIFLSIVNPFDLPWGAREFVNGLYERFEKMVIEDYELREHTDALSQGISSNVAMLSFQLASEYRFEVEWDLKKYLKAFGFGVDFFSDDSLLDNLLKFIALASDVFSKRVLLFANLKTFLLKEELETLYAKAFSCDIALMLLENALDSNYYVYEEKRSIDQCFLEH